MKQEWISLCNRVGLISPEEKWIAMHDLYSEVGRFYHTLDHIKAMHHRFSLNRGRFQSPDEVEFAIFMHDIIYDTKRSDNEQLSAYLAKEWAFGSRLDVDLIDRLISGTTHNQTDEWPDLNLLLDIDIQILAADPDVYDWYAGAIRQEYQWVPSPIYRQERVKVLKMFMDKAALFSTDICGSLSNEKARQNIAREIASLTSSS